jgi:hypothetical protein
MSAPVQPEPYSMENMAIDSREGFFHTMLSYRVSTDQDFVSKLHDKIHLLAPFAVLDSSPYPAGFRQDESVMNSSMRVFQDAYCLRDGMGWEGNGGIKNGGFIGALRLSFVFVPVFSVKVDGNGQIISPGEGSIGQLIQLANVDKQDNVLLELIIARELHVLYEKCGRKVLFPCSYILPLFRNKEVWEAAKLLPNKPSAITNAKALHVMEQLGVPSSAVSIELSTETLTVKAVWDFFTKFQGNMLYDYGKESFQIVAAAKAIIGVVRESLSDVNLYDPDMNFAQMYELFGFMSQLNMANYTAVLAAHDITNVAQLAYLDHNGADAVMRSIADQCARASDRSSVPNELVRLRCAVAAARSSPLGRPLNERFQNFIDHDASFVTVLSSSSFCDILVSKWQSWMVIVPAILFTIGYNSWTIYLNVTSVVTHDDGLVFPNNESFANAWAIQGIVCYLIVICLACPVSIFKSPRHGRYMVAVALFVWATSLTFVFSVSVYSAIHSDCIDCAYFSDSLNNGSITQKILAQPMNFIVLWVAFLCVLFRQQYTVPVCLSLLIVLSIPSVVFLAQGLIIYRRIGSYFVFISAYVALKVLRFIGNRRARSIFDLNKVKIEEEYSKLRDSSPILASRKLESPTRCCFFVKRRHNSFGMTLVTPLLDTHDTISTTAPPSRPSESVRKKQLDVDSCFQMENIGKQQLLQSHASFESLIRDAEFINFAFQEWVSSWLSNGPDMDKIQRNLYQSADGIDASLCGLSSKLAASPINGTHIRGPVKHVDRSIQKVWIKWQTLFFRKVPQDCIPAALQSYLKVLPLFQM